MMTRISLAVGAFALATCSTIYANLCIMKMVTAVNAHRPHEQRLPTTALNGQLSYTLHEYRACAPESRLPLRMWTAIVVGVVSTVVVGIALGLLPGLD